MLGVTYACLLMGENGFVLGCFQGRDLPFYDAVFRYPLIVNRGCVHGSVCKNTTPTPMPTING